MPGPAIEDHSPHDPVAVERRANASRLVLIDNYDSFTWNVYQYLVLEGASVTVYRNDEVTLEALIATDPTQLVISPGPGHPNRDAGISCEAIRHFAGRIPVLGVCMGEQCIFTAFGGSVSGTGEILHGKTSPLAHDGRGVFAGLPQDIPVTRYHSLAGTHLSLPDCLEVSAWIPSDRGDEQGTIMGVRHKEFLVEGVQFHPESILTAEGRRMLRNFLDMSGGTWAKNGPGDQLQVRAPTTTSNGHSSHNGTHTNGNGASKDASILQEIYERRKEAVALRQALPSYRRVDLEAAYRLDLAPPLVSFPQRLRDSPLSLSLLAEIKRASPSKGPISMDVNVPAQAQKYAQAGASVISVLTEPDWFHGTLDDLRLVRSVVHSMPMRPAILRKDFIFDEYQILEARLAGADTILLIVKMLDHDSLTRLYHYSQSLGMEPLVEVNTPEEMQRALALGAEVIGINNRNLTSFEVDLETTTRLLKDVSPTTFICALSGISGPEDVAGYRQRGVGGVLIGEALMRTADVEMFVPRLLGGTDTITLKESQQPLLVKICGTRSVEAAQAAIDAGADMIGIILVPNRKRTIVPEQALAISKLIHGDRRADGPEAPVDPVVAPGADYFEVAVSALQRRDRALLVGVFQNQPLGYILEQQALLNLDVVQLHGSEPLEWASLIRVPVLRRFGAHDPGLTSRGYHTAPLLDGAAGGTGDELDHIPILNRLSSDSGVRVMMAGGLTPANLRDKLTRLSPLRRNIIGVDVSSGVELNGQQDLGKIREFVQIAKGYDGQS